MNKPLRIICVLLVMVAVITVAGFSACDSDRSPTDTTADPNSITETDENDFSSESTTNTNPNDDVSSWDAIETIESDLFAQCIIDAYAYMVWPYMGLNAPREVYSGYEPSWRFAHCPSYWIDEMIHVNALPTVVELYRTTPPDEEYGYTPLEIVDIVSLTTCPFNGKYDIFLMQLFATKKMRPICQKRKTAVQLVQHSVKYSCLKK